MQVFLPYPDLKLSVCSLDQKRLGNQVYRECLTIIRGGWPNHPTSRMWKGYERALASYALFGLEELSRRGHPYAHHVSTFLSYLDGPVLLPDWLGDRKLHASHRSALLYKNQDWYQQFGWKDKPAKPDANGKLLYVWPATQC